MPLGEALLELRHAPLHEPQVPGPTLEIVEGRRERSGAVAGAAEGSVELAGPLFQSLGDARRLRPQLRCRSRCSVAESSTTCCRSSSRPNALVCSASASRLRARASSAV